MNALKHGILSNQVLVCGLNLKECDREFAALHRRFCEDLQPVGPVEEMLVDEIVTTHWRLRRALTAESGEIALSVDGFQWRSSQLQRRYQWAEWMERGDPARNMEESALGNHILAGWLRGVRRAVEQAGELTAAAIQALNQHFGERPNFLTNRLEALRWQGQDNQEGLVAEALRERNKQQVLAFLNKELEGLYGREDDCAEREKLEQAANRAAAVLPLPEVLEKILRYETVLKRWLHRCMLQLERVQRRRQGESVPAPMSVEISERG